MDKIALIDYGVGNLGSVKNTLAFWQQNTQNLDAMRRFSISVESCPDKLKDYDKLILPGVGAFGNAMEHLKRAHLTEAIHAFAQSGKYLLGICLGMQLLFEESDEFGSHQGLGLIEGQICKFSNIAPLQIPHVGWNSCALTPRGRCSALLQGIEDGSFLYFVHSFHVRTQEQFVLAYCHYGYPFAAIVNKHNLFGIQPHPEKSHNIGLRLLKNFIDMH